MFLSQPTWFADLDAWWVPATGDDISRHVEPLGVDDQHRLHVRASSPAWLTQTRLIANILTTRINEILASDAAELTGIIVVSGQGDPSPSR